MDADMQLSHVYLMSYLGVMHVIKCPRESLGTRVCIVEVCKMCACSESKK